jgi:hypothetical protein
MHVVDRSRRAVALLDGHRLPIPYDREPYVLEQRVLIIVHVEHAERSVIHNNIRRNSGAEESRGRRRQTESHNYTFTVTGENDGVRWLWLRIGRWLNYVEF